MKRTRILAAALLFLVLLLIGIACTQSRTFSYQPMRGSWKTVSMFRIISSRKLPFGSA